MSIYCPLSEALGILPPSNPIDYNDIDCVEISSGGSGFQGRKHSPETKLAMSQWVRTDECRRKMSLKLSGKNNPMYGKKHTVESNIKRTKSLGSKVSVDGVIYNSIREAGRRIGVSKTTIRTWLKEKKKNARYID